MYYLLPPPQHPLFVNSNKNIIIKNSIPLSPQPFPPNNPLKGPPPQQFLASSLHPHPLLSSCMFLPPFLLYIV